ncbi:MAG: hypothetical protein K0Q59_6117 [Paenibacillus sp.]|nr:hypothetical protein [Paenibacillus sp.]
MVLSGFHADTPNSRGYVYIDRYFFIHFLPLLLRFDFRIPIFRLFGAHVFAEAENIGALLLGFLNQFLVRFDEGFLVFLFDFFQNIGMVDGKLLVDLLLQIDFGKFR